MQNPLDRAMPSAIRISVIIPCFNSADVIEDTLRSVFAQRFAAEEVLVYNDASSDETMTVLAACQTRWPGLKVFSDDLNRGAGYARRYLLKQATGSHVAFLDADDIWLPEKLEIQAQLIQRENVDLVVSAYRIVDRAGSFLGARKPKSNFGYRDMLMTNWIPMSTVLASRSLKGIAEMPLMRRRQDYAYWLMIFRRNPNLKLAVHPDPLMIYRRASGSLSSNMLENLRSNYQVFRQEEQFSAIASIMLLGLNMMFRVFRR
ncbi:MAG: glycosyltransferase family 2 protein [Pseudomonadota bacterium]